MALHKTKLKSISISFTDDISSKKTIYNLNRGQRRIEMFKVKLRSSKSSRLLQRLAFLISM